MISLVRPCQSQIVVSRKVIGLCRQSGREIGDRQIGLAPFAISDSAPDQGIHVVGLEFDRSIVTRQLFVATVQLSQLLTLLEESVGVFRIDSNT